MKLLVIAVMFCVAALPAPARAESDLEKLIDLMGCYEQIEQMRVASRHQVEEVRQTMVRESSLLFQNDPDGLAQAAFDAAFTEFTAAIAPVWTTEEAVSKYKALLAEYYTPGEITALVQFYSSPLGAKIREVTPRMQADWVGYLTAGEQERIAAAFSEFQTNFKAALPKR